MKYLVILFFLLVSIAGFSQDLIDHEPMSTDRPDQTETPVLVPAGMFQIESGLSYERTGSNESAIVVPTVLWKYGVNKNFELRLITEYTTNRVKNENISGLNPVLVGLKVKLADEKGIIPKTSFIGHVLIPDFASEDFKANHYAAEFRFTMQHSLSDKLSLGYNIGAEWDGISPEATFIYTVTTGFVLTEKLGAYTEAFGFAPEADAARHSFDGGFTYLLSDNMMVDVSGGFGLTENAPDYFSALGFSFRL